MACRLCGGEDRWIKTVRDGEGRTFPACDPCYLAADPGSLVIVPGLISVTGRCDQCDRFLNPRELAVLRSLVRERHVGICVSCVGTRGCYEPNQKRLRNAENGVLRETDPTGESASQCGFHPSS